MDTSRSDVDRRKFLNGKWQVRPSGPTVEIASVLVQARPERLDAAARAIEALPGTQIYSRDPKGKLVVVIEASDVGGIGADTQYHLPDAGRVDRITRVSRHRRELNSSR